MTSGDLLITLGRVGSSFQFSNATPTKSPSRQISWHMRPVRKLSKDNSKFSGRAGKSRVQMPAPRLVISLTAHERTPVCPVKNSKADLAILVLAIDRRSKALSH